jgi:drug/metabolite transporter (DMT)-like permease
MTTRPHGSTGPVLALTAAALFGLSAPAAKLLVGAVDPWLLAGLLYLGSGVGLTAYHLVRRRKATIAEAPLAARDVPWLATAVAAGGVAGPVLLMFGLASGSAAQVALLLNLEGLFTALLAWCIFREHVGARIAIGMLAIVVGASVLVWAPAALVTVDSSAVLVAAACLAWAVDNNLTRKISASDPVQIAALKGATAGIVNVIVAIGRGAPWPSPALVVIAGVIGLVAYGTSLVLFILALRHLGTARTGAYFSTAPFVGSIASLVILGEALTVQLVIAAVCMGVGVCLHLTERHRHEHVHEPLEHEHAHRHDEHHRHEHHPGTPDAEVHTHWHAHVALRHQHPHYPDVHHRHSH